MRIHLPRPLHGWREFVGEIAIVVIGVLIALGAQSLLEQWRWREEVRAASEAFKEELKTASLMAYERLIIQPCLQGRIRDLAQRLADSDGAWTASPMKVSSNQYLNVMPIAYRAPSRPLMTDAWRSAIANGTLRHLPPERAQELSALYEQISRFREIQHDEAKAAASLTPLAFDRSLDAAGRTGMLAALAEVDRINALMSLQAGQIIEAVAALRLDYAKADIEATKREVVQGQRQARGTCATSLPLDLG